MWFTLLLSASADAATPAQRGKATGNPRRLREMRAGLISAPMESRKPRKEGAAAFIGAHRSRMNRDVLRIRLQERDRREASDTRTEAQRWLGDPPASRSALAAKPK
jgi:hypothetical protein